MYHLRSIISGLCHLGIDHFGMIIHLRVSRTVISGSGNVCIYRYHRGVLSQYVHIGYITQALYCRIIHRAFVLNVFICSMNHHTTGLSI